MRDDVIKKILFINDTMDDNNLGCKATTNALYELIEERLPNFEVKDIIKLYHTERPGIADKIPGTFSEFDSMCEKWVSDENIETRFEMEKLKSCDIVLINGEGSIYKDVLKCRYQLFVAYLAKKYLSKKIYLVNHTADLSLVHNIAANVYPILDGIVAREPITQREIQSLGITNVKLAPDAVFKYNIPENNLINRSLPFGFNLNKKFLIIGGTSLNHPIYKKWYGDWNIESFKNLIKTIQYNTGIQVLLADVGGDDFLRYYDNISGVFYGKFNYTDYMILCSKALLHLSGRHHATCLAAISGCPIIGITANTHKLQGDFEILDWELPVYDFYNIDNNLNNIIECLINVITNNKVYREKIKNCVTKVKENVFTNVDIILNKVL